MAGVVPTLSQEAVERLLFAAADQTRDYALILLDVNGHIVWWNTGAEHIFDISKDKAIGRHSSMIFTPDDQARGLSELELRIAKHDVASEDDRWHVRGDGSRFWSSGALVPLRNDVGELIGFGKFLRNRTSVKEQLERLREEVRVAREAEETQKTGVATLSHELRNVLTGFKHGLTLMRTQGSDADRREELLTMMEEQTALVHRLTDDLLDIARISRGKLQLKLAAVRLQDALQHAVSQRESEAQVKRLQLHLLMPPGPIVIVADPARLQQILGNLLDNAIKYTPEGGRIWVKLTTEDPEAVVHVQDNGIGIPPDMLDQIFELFTQVETDLSHRGLGIGLSLVKNLVALHGGSVQASSEGEGKGSEFTVRLPLQV